VAGAEKFARRSQLHFYGAWNPPSLPSCLGPPRWISGLVVKWPKPKVNMQDVAAGREHCNESEHARVFQNTETFCSKIFSGYSRDWGSSINHRSWTILLPVGISFYTFHSLSYTLDILSGRAAADESLRDFILARLLFFRSWLPVQSCALVTFSPASPSSALEKRPISLGSSADDSGTVSEIVLADTMLSSAADRVFTYPGPLVALDSWPACWHLRANLFRFAGYSLCAIGAALTLGFHSKTTFASLCRDRLFGFWRRWHISLSTFLRDYLYIPLGGNQVRPVRATLNLVIVMFIGGLWHGAAWTFVVWGLLHGSYLVIERVFRVSFEHKPWANTLPVRVLAGFATYAAVCIAWVFFRASDFTIASRMLGGMFGQHPHGDAILSTRELLQSEASPPV